MVGLLSLLWLWAIDNAEDGDLSRVTSRTVARAAQWEGDPDAFVKAIERAGFIDSDPCMLHDWLDYSGKLLEQREQKRAQNRERQQRYRDKNVLRASLQSNDRVTDVSRVNNALISDSTVPNLTVPDRTKPMVDILPHTPITSDDEKHEKQTNLQIKRFDEFWSAYPKKVGKGVARKAWARIKPTGELHSKILDAIAEAKQSDQWRRNGGQYIPNPATWLNQERWLDELPKLKEDFDHAIDQRNYDKPDDYYNCPGFHTTDAR